MVKFLACVASVSTRFIAKKLELFCSRPTFLEELARKRLLRRLQNFSPLTDIPVAKTEISGTEPVHSLWYEHIENFTKDLEARRDLGNRTHAKKPLVVYVFAYPSVCDGLFLYQNLGEQELRFKVLRKTSFNSYLSLDFINRFPAFMNAAYFLPKETWHINV